MVEELQTTISEDFGFKQIAKPISILPNYKDEQLPYTSIHNLDILNYPSTSTPLFIAATSTKVIIGDLQSLRNFAVSETEESNFDIKWEKNVDNTILTKFLPSENLAIIINQSFDEIYQVDLTNFTETKLSFKFSDSIRQSMVYGTDLIILSNNGSLSIVKILENNASPVMLKSNTVSFDILNDSIFCFKDNHSVEVYFMPTFIAKSQSETPNLTITPPDDLLQEFDDQYLPYLINALDKSTFILIWGEPINLEDVNYDFKSYLVTASNGQFQFKESFDITPAFGQVLRYPTLYKIPLTNLLPEPVQSINLIASSTSSEITIIDKNEVFQPAQDSERLSLPLNEQTDNDTNPIGMSLDIATTGSIDQPCPGVDTVSQLPLIYILNNEGQIQINALYNVAHLKSNTFNINALETLIKNSYKENKGNDIQLAKLSLDNNSVQNNSKSDDTTSESSLNKPATTDSPFGKPLFGSTSTDSPFGKPALGTTSTYSPFGKPAFGTTSTESPFGKPAFGSSTTDSPFGKPSFGTTSTFGKPSFGTTSTDSPFGKPAFGTTSTDSPFGKPAFGTSSADSPFSKLSSNQSQSNEPNFGDSITTEKSANPAFSQHTFGKSNFGQTPYNTVNSEISGSFGSKPFSSSFGAFSSNNNSNSSSPFANLGKEKITTSDEEQKPKSFSDFPKFDSSNISAFGKPVFGEPSTSNIESPFKHLLQKEQEKDNTSTSDDFKDSTVENTVEPEEPPQKDDIDEDKTTNENSKDSTQIKDESATANNTVSVSESLIKGETDDATQTNDILSFTERLKKSTNFSGLDNDSLKQSFTTLSSKGTSASPFASFQNNFSKSPNASKFSFNKPTSSITSTDGSAESTILNTNSKEDLKEGQVSEKNLFSKQPLNTAMEHEKNSTIHQEKEDHQEQKDENAQEQNIKADIQTENKDFPQQENNNLLQKSNEDIQQETEEVLKKENEVNIQKEDLTDLQKEDIAALKKETDADPQKESKNLLQDRSEEIGSNNNIDNCNNDVIEEKSSDTENEDESEKEVDEGDFPFPNVAEVQPLPTDNIDEDVEQTDGSLPTSFEVISSNTNTNDTTPTEASDEENGREIMSQGTQTISLVDTVEFSMQTDPIQLVSNGTQVPHAPTSDFGMQTAPVEVCDFELQAFEKEESYLADYYKPIKLKSYYPCADVSNMKFNSTDPIMQRIEATYYNIEGELLVMQENSDNLGKYIKDQSTIEIHNRSLNTINNIYTWRIPEISTLMDLLKKHGESMEGIYQKLNSMLEDVEESEKSISILSKFYSEFSKAKKDIKKLQMIKDKSLERLRDLDCHQWLKQISLRNKLEQATKKINEIEELLNILKLYTIKAGRLNENPYVIKLAQESATHKDLLLSINTLSDQVRQLLGDSKAIKPVENIPKLESSMKSLDIAQLGMSINTKREIGLFFKNMEIQETTA
ncbi:hypothetical protein TBLA_0E03890 [Henningerozyma blattae CBS 6284]|uniref:Nucleoporin Nup159/Nup146 N-terminal domain-containing protein n=1 Tax=Henningerozyma blattae (strain ATCC 34711 / CBS 6284 / DSM 70876 / NBRC 10599 / NRRL Y-10934 / UCD 77-7) TaxID=1071380 RepID=I2H4Z2_HENB6|nr:hypothetical protein TBLA_0E03890 [Tetrapisispora blattae CBS 6284]CCH61444.1 hypothetical protein TBLA_0E03890 [Tetrapisispora blattae CBS 6284]